MKPCEKHPGAKRYKSGACSACAIAAQKRWAQKNKGKVSASFGKWRSENHEAHKRMVRRGHYIKAGVNPDLAEAVRSQHRGGCECCGSLSPNGNSWCVDHDHTTGRIRGVLCHKCNQGLGLLGDTLQGVLLAVRYLQRETA